MRQRIGLAMLLAAFIVPPSVAFGLEFGVLRLLGLAGCIGYLVLACWLAVKR